MSVTPEQRRLLDEARAWFSAEQQAIARAHGARWPEHRDWMRDYLLAEVRERLAAQGWHDPPL